MILYRNMPMNSFYPVLLYLVHTVVWIRLYIWTYVNRILGRASAMSSNLFEFQRKRMGDKCRADSRILPKLPLHVGLQILENQCSEKDVANIVTWCMAMGIPYITIFDTQGHFKEHSASLSRRIEHRVEEICTPNDALVFQMESPRRNGEISSEICHKPSSDVAAKTRIAVVSSVDGRQDIVDAARQIGRNVAHNRHTASDIGISHLDELINTSSTFPDPELIIQFGTTESLLGYAPWKIRVTEIMCLPSHHGMDYHSLLSVLQSFSDTKQRFGK